jgi:hypothetical protein
MVRDNLPRHTFSGAVNLSAQRAIRDLFDEMYPTMGESNSHLPGLLAAGQKAAFSIPLESLCETDSVHSFAYKASLFLARKVLPVKTVDPVPTLEKWSVTPTINPAFCRTIDHVVARLFRGNWDKSYDRICRSVKMNNKSCLERSRSDGGAVGNFVDCGMSLLDFYALTSSGTRIDPMRRVEIINKDGKSRMVTVASMTQHQLLPLHVTIYDHLSRQSWLLKRSDRVRVLKDFVCKSGEFFVSGDYEAATDSFNSEHSRRMLSDIFAHSSHIPVGIQKAALDSLVGTVQWNGKVYEQKTGQLMGNFLSFPLLCLTNFCSVVHAFGWDRATTIPLKINGDDIVFRCTRTEYGLWSKLVSDSGLVLSRGKTLFHSRFFSINSAFFHALPRRVKVVPVLRVGTIFKKNLNEPDQLAGIIKSATWGWYGKARRRLTTWIAKRYYRIVVKGPSLTRGFGLKLTPNEFLKDGGLMKHELSRLELPAHIDKVPVKRTEPVMFKGFQKLRVASFCKSCETDLRAQMTIATNVGAFKVEKKKK